jgi:hypothetical protein
MARRLTPAPNELLPGGAGGLAAGALKNPEASRRLRLPIRTPAPKATGRSPAADPRYSPNGREAA